MIGASRAHRQEIRLAVGALVLIIVEAVVLALIVIVIVVVMTVFSLIGRGAVRVAVTTTMPTMRVAMSSLTYYASQRGDQKNQDQKSMHDRRRQERNTEGQKKNYPQDSRTLLSC